MSLEGNIVVTGASGQLGRLAIAELVRQGAGARVIGLVRSEKSAKQLEAEGVSARIADYNDRAALAAGLRGAAKVLLVSSSEVGQRVPQHANVLAAAKEAGVQRLAYTSILNADSNPMLLAGEHKETERLIRASGLPFAFLRNGWYVENHTQALGAALQHGAVIGSAGAGKFATASRGDYAAAAAAVLLQKEFGAQAVYELAGDHAYTLAEFAAEVSRQTGKTIVYQNLPQQAYAAALASFGLPEPFANVLAESDAQAATGILNDDSRTLSRLIGRPTTAMPAAVTAALAQLQGR
jgi:NAD(P)H dehydrogenase (quinone)